jgi:ATP-dependent protease ClpP protease subunit
VKHLVLVFSFLVIGCTSLKDVGESSQNSKATVGIEDGQLIYKGEITETSNNVIFSLFRAAELKPNRLLISSQGGEIGAGMDLGQWVKDNDLDVEIIRVCASSCANYVLPAANTKYLRKDSVLIWHGSAWQTNWHVDKERRESFNSYITLMRQRETEFYADITVDNLITTYGQSKFDFLDFALSLLGKGTVGYDYSLADMEKLGLVNIVLIDGEWNWRTHRPDKANLVKRIKLDNDFQFELRRFEI